MYSLSDLMPLRTTADWGTYQDAQPIPIAFGDLRSAPVACVQYDQYRRQWVPSAGEVVVATVRVDDLPVDGWSASAVSDASGQTVTVITLSAPAPEGVAVSAGVLGLRHPTSGAVLDTPDGVIWYVLNQLAGRPVEQVVLDSLRVAAGQDGLRIAGVIANAAQTLRATFIDVVTGCGLIWCDSLFAVYPADTFPATPVVATWSALDIAEIALSATATDTAGRVRVLYDYQAATGRYQSVIERAITAPIYGINLRTIESRWLRDARAADRLARRSLERLAGHNLAVTLRPRKDALRQPIWPGDYIALSHPILPLDPAPMTMIVLGTTEQPDGSQILSGEIRWGDTPTTRITTTATLFPAAEAAGVGVAIKQGMAILTIYDADGRPAPGALVALDGGLAQYADASGVVRVSATPGKHKVAVQLEGYTPYELEILVP